LIISNCSCTIQGEEICGTWNASGEYGQMQLEITPWKGKFLAYLLSYESDGQTIKGAKTEDHIFITDLTYNEGKYQNGKIYINPLSETYCNLNIELMSIHQLQVLYDCEGQSYEEFWFRKGFSNPQKPAQATTALKHDIATRDHEKINDVDVKTKSEQSLGNSFNVTNNVNPNSGFENDNQTIKQSSIFIIGISEVVKYDHRKEMEITLDKLWTQSYNNDFSSKFKNITEANKMYLCYSSYDNPKGTMTVTLGYKLENGHDVPEGLNGVRIPANDFLVYPMSGKKSDYEGEGWQQLEEMMAYRNEDAVDFEVYEFDNSYNVKSAEMWIATK